MNWKWMIVGSFGILLGLSIAPLDHRAVSASTTPASIHFQMQPATVDESNGQGQRVPVHELFLLNTESGEIWQFQGATMVLDQNKGEAIPIGPKFSRVPVESSR
jgi:hypothetical protein